MMNMQKKKLEMSIMSYVGQINFIYYNLEDEQIKYDNIIKVETFDEWLKILDSDLDRVKKHWYFK